MYLFIYIVAEDNAEGEANDSQAQDDDDIAMPPADELENWEQTVDEILQDESDKPNG